MNVLVLLTENYNELENKIEKLNDLKVQIVIIGKWQPFLQKHRNIQTFKSHKNNPNWVLK